MSRTFVVLVTVFIALTANKKLDSFLALLGASSCIPIAFILPAVFHYRLCAFTKKEKFMDLSIVFISIAIAIFCSVNTIIHW